MEGKAMAKMHSASDSHPVYPLIVLPLYPLFLHDTYHLNYIIHLFA